MPTERLEQLIVKEYIHARNTEDHAKRVTKKIQKEIEEMWTDIALYALACGIENYPAFAEYGFRRIGGKPHEEEYGRLKECGIHVGGTGLEVKADVGSNPTPSIKV